MSRLRKIGLSAALLLVVVILAPVAMHFRAQWRWNSYRKELIAKGEKLTVEELTPKPAKDATNTGEYIKGSSKLSKMWDPRPGAVRGIKPGVARVAWRERRCMEDDIENALIDVWPGFSEIIKANEATLNRVGWLAAGGGVHFVDDVRPLHRVSATQTVSQLLGASEAGPALDAMAILNLHKGRKDEALNQLINSLRLSKLEGENPELINQVVRRGSVAFMVATTWEMLQENGWRDSQLEFLQNEWERQDFLGDLSRTLAVDRDISLYFFEGSRRPENSMATELEGFKIKGAREAWGIFQQNWREGIKTAVTFYPRFWSWCWIGSYNDERNYIKRMQVMIDAGSDPGKKAVGQAILEKWAGNVRLAQQVQETGAYLASVASAQEEANLVITAIALERYKLAHNKYPATLKDMVPALLKVVPLDIGDGKELRYRLNEDGTFVLYSVGTDGVDDGGDPTPKGSDMPGFRRGRDMVWPRAATPEEVAAFDK